MAIKTAKTKTVRKNTDMYHSGPSSKQTGQEFTGSLEKVSFRLFLFFLTF